MKKTNPTNKTKGLFGFLTTLTLALGVGVSIAPKEVVKTKAASTYNWSASSSSEATALGNASGNATLGGITWAYTRANAGYEGYVGGSSAWITLGSNAQPAGTTTLKASLPTSYGSEIESVSVSTSGYSAAWKFEIKVGGISRFSGNLTTSIAEYTSGSMAAGTTGEIELIWTDGPRNLNLKSIKIVGRDQSVPIDSVTVSPDEASIFVGGTTKLSAEVLPSSAPKDVKWESSDEAVATVDEDGLVTGISAGDATITVSSKTDATKLDTALIQVSPVSVESVSLNKTSVELYEGKTEQLTATVLPENATNKNVTWSSQNTDVVTVSNGLLTAVGAGTTTVKVTTVDGEEEASVTVTVLANPVSTLIVNHTSVQKTYALGEEFDGFAGLVVKEKRANNEETVIEDYDISTVDTMELGKQVVRVQKGDFHEEFIINVTNEGAAVGTINQPGVTYTETFTDSNLTSSYGDGSFTGVGGVEFSYEHSRDAGIGTTDEYAIDGEGLMLRRSNEPSSLSFILPEGLDSLRFDYMKAFTGNTARKISVKIGDNDAIETESVLGDGVIYKYVVNNLGLTSATEITIKLYGATGNQQVTIDNLSWTTVGIFVDGMSYETQAKAFARFVGRAVLSGTDGKLISKSLLGPATQLAPTWEEVEAEKGAMDSESLVVFENSDDPEIVAGREIYQELLEENNEAYADAVEFAAWMMHGDRDEEACVDKFEEAESKWGGLSAEAKALFKSESEFADARARLNNWAIANGLSAFEDLDNTGSGSKGALQSNNTSFITLTVLIGIVGLSALAGYNFLKKKKEA